jgi:hypothetical protein
VSADNAARLRAQQLADIKESSFESERYDYGQSAAELLEEDESLESSLALIKKDLKAKYVYFDAACRDLGSKAVSWEALAAELLSEISCKIDKHLAGMATDLIMGLAYQGERGS